MLPVTEESREHIFKATAWDVVVSSVYFGFICGFLFQSVMIIRRCTILFLVHLISVVFPSRRTPNMMFSNIYTVDLSLPRFISSFIKGQDLEA